MPNAVVLKRPTSPRRITVAAVRGVLEEVVAAHPGRADRRAVDGLPARYIDRGGPNCLVAHVLARLGFSVGVLRALDQEHPVGELVQPGVKVAESRHPALRKLDPHARLLLQHVQDHQDRGEPWRHIVTHAFAGKRWMGAGWNRRVRPWMFTT